MHVIVWRFEVDPGHEREFVEAYGPNGRWAKLFSKADGFIGVELLRDTSDPLVLLTIDRWETDAAFDAFKERFAAEYKALDASLERLTRDERHVGSFQAAFKASTGHDVLTPRPAP